MNQPCDGTRKLAEWNVGDVRLEVFLKNNAKKYG
jgi:hypothetical protein